jgi:hypothetical protein
MEEEEPQKEPIKREVPPLVAGLHSPYPEDEVPPSTEVGPDGRDLSVQKWLADKEEDRKAQEEEESKPLTVVEFTPGQVGPGSWRRVAIAVLVVIVVIVAMYAVVVPRANAELVIRYNEGTMGGINVDARIENHGTRDMTEVKLTILVQNSSDVRMADPQSFDGFISAYSDASMDAISFQGDQWDTYHIFVEWEFECAGKRYQGSESYDTKGDAMNVWFTQDLTP